MTIAIEINQLNKRFGRGKRAFKAVDDLNLTVETGQVYGFLGPNGAGKSTTIRMLLGLSAPTSGTIRLFGESGDTLAGILQKRVGALVETATLYPYMTGAENLEVLARTSGVYDTDRIAYLLDLVGMTDRSKRKAKGYSTGMKQRIGIAAALLNDPDLVILDEPTSGLDPRGIQEIRTLIRRLVDEMGKTVFLSSHMLHEVEQVCDRVAIINRGKLIAGGTVSELPGDQSTLHLRVDDCDRAAALLRSAWDITPDAGNSLIVHVSEQDTPRLIAHLVENNIGIYQVTPRKASLEDYFLTVTGSTDPDKEIA